MAGRLSEVVLVRHGESEWSRSGRYAGRVDVPLTARGRREMQAVGRILAPRNLPRILSSPLRRAYDSCRLAGFADRAELREELIEWDYGDWEGHTAAEVNGSALWSTGAPGGETAETVGRRIDRIVDELRAGDGAAIFAHRDVLRVLAARWLGLPPEAGRMLSLATASISVLGSEGGVPALISWNECRWP